MPLKKATSDKARQANIKKEIAAGKPPKQAVAIGYAVQREAIAKKGGKVIFVGTKKQSKDIIELGAKRCGAYYVTERWLGGTMTNLEVVGKSVKKLVDYKKGRENGQFDKYTKKERLLIDREIEKLERKVGGLIGLNTKPVALFIIDPKRENYCKWFDFSQGGST